MPVVGRQGEDGSVVPVTPEDAAGQASVRRQETSQRKSERREEKEAARANGYLARAREVNNRPTTAPSKEKFRGWIAMWNAMKIERVSISPQISEAHGLNALLEESEKQTALLEEIRDALIVLTSDVSAFVGPSKPPTIRHE